MPISCTLTNLYARQRDIDKATQKNKHEPNIYIASIRRQLCIFKQKILDHDIERFYKKPDETTNFRTPR